MESTGRLRETPTVPAQLTASPLARVVPTNTATAPGAPTTAGSDGPFTLQVSSFRTAPQAQLFAQRLREHGHHAFVASGIGPNGSTWHRVRIGPFSAQHDADRYRSTFEARERLPTFVVRRDAPVHTNER